MARLFWKELRSSLWLTAAAALVVMIGGFRHDAMSFHDRNSSGTVVLAALPMLLLGMKSYSDELAKGTVDFLYSRPIPWWKSWIAKLVTGLVAVAAVTVFACLVYAVLAPVQYRPFLSYAFYQGFPVFLIALGTAYGVGFVVSVLLPGLALSFAPFIGAVIAFFFVTAMAELMGNMLHIRWLWYPEGQGAPPVALLMFFGMLLANILIARRLPKLTIPGKLRIWFTGGLVGIVCSFALLGLGIAGLSSSNLEVKSLSPNGKYAVYLVSPMPFMKVVDLENGDTVLNLPPGFFGPVSWSHDSRKLAWVEGPGLFRIADVGKGRVESQVALTLKDKPHEWTLGFVGWSPDDSRIAIINLPYREKNGLLWVIDASTHSVQTSDLIVPRGISGNTIHGALTSYENDIPSGPMTVLWSSSGGKEPVVYWTNVTVSSDDGGC